MHVHAHAVFTFTSVFTRVHACMANVASMLAGYLSTVQITHNLNGPRV